MFKRLIKLPKNNSFFLFGPRGTGKTTLLENYLNPSQTIKIDLLDPDFEYRLSLRPSELSDIIKAASKNIKWVFIDEIQKIPKLLDIVHRETERGYLNFALTGSSARKLKRGAANLLAGRAFVYHLFPLTHREIGDNFHLRQALEFGTLPKLFRLPDTEKKDFLRAYTNTYIKEEIKEEQIVRKLDPFRRFLEIAAQTNGEIVNYTNISRDVGADPKTVQSYFEILEDTLTGFLLDPFHLSVRKRQRCNPKFYFFDPGVKRALERTLTVELLPQTYAFGKAFEHFIIAEIIRLNSYLKKDYRFSYLRTKDNAEVDLIIERPGMPTALVEIKSAEKIKEQHIINLKRFGKDFEKCELFILSLDRVIKKINGVNVLHWIKGIEELGL